MVKNHSILQTSRDEGLLVLGLAHAATTAKGTFWQLSESLASLNLKPLRPFSPSSSTAHSSSAAPWWGWELARQCGCQSLSSASSQAAGTQLESRRSNGAAGMCNIFFVLCIWKNIFQISWGSVSWLGCSFSGLCFNFFFFLRNYLKLSADRFLAFSWKYCYASQKNLRYRDLGYISDTAVQDLRGWAQQGGTVT